MIAGKRRDMGLGGFPDVSLAEAREKARKARSQIEEGLDPIAERRSKKHALKASAATALTFTDAAKLYMAAHEAGWRNAKHREQWKNTLALAEEKFGKKQVQDVDVDDVLSVLKPIWHSRTETASRLRQRIEAVLSYAKAKDNGRNQRVFAPHWLNPARWPDHLATMLPKPSKIKAKGHMAALPVADVAAFMSDLRKVGGQGAKALEFLILTAARSGEVRGAVWSEIDLKAKVWIIPAARMKSGREHRVPLVPAAVELLEGLPRMAGTDLVFPGSRGQPLSDRTLLAVLRRMDVDVTAHGFRSTFRDWCGEHTNFPREIAEAALAHATGNEVERAYRRGDALEKRRKLMAAWADFCARPAAVADNVRKIGGNR
jgi:integrase